MYVIVLFDIVIMIHFIQLIETGAYGKVMRAVYDETDVAVKYFRSAEEKRGYKQEVCI